MRGAAGQRKKPVAGRGAGTTQQDGVPTGELMIQRQAVHMGTANRDVDPITKGLGGLRDRYTNIEGT